MCPGDDGLLQTKLIYRFLSLSSSLSTTSSLSLVDMIPEEKLRGRHSSESDREGMGHDSHKRTHRLSDSDGGSTEGCNYDLFAEQCDILQEMFPDSSFIEVCARGKKGSVCATRMYHFLLHIHSQVKHCTLIANGDVDRATQILLHRQEAGQSLKGPSNNMLQANKPHQQVDEHELKNRIISKYVLKAPFETQFYGSTPESLSLHLSLTTPTDIRTWIRTGRTAGSTNRSPRRWSRRR